MLHREVLKCTSVASSLNCSLQHGLLKITSNLEQDAAGSLANLCVLVFM